jgi:tRNA A-37 threonylcarbamoyl transferase component Bud32
MQTAVKHSDISVLSPYFSLPDASEVIGKNKVADRPEIRLLREKKLFILSNDHGKVFLINPTIKTFLEAFKKPKKLDQVIEEFAEMSSCRPDQIEAAMQSFYKDMSDEGIIIPKDIAENISQILKDEPNNSAHYNSGDIIGKYQVIKEINIRQASQLYLAKAPDSHRQVVIKTIIYPELLPKEVKNRSWKKFSQEFKLMESLGHHPNVCELIEINEEGQNPFAAIEYIQGQSIRAYIKNNELDINRKLKLIHQVISAIAHVQSQRIVHGDIHLSNFLVNQDEQIKLIDFGLSNHVKLENGEIKRNGGVYECIPPERVKNGSFSFLAQRADFRSEVFQLGVIAFYILYGHYPFSGFTWQELAEAIKNEPVQLEKTTKEGDQIPEQVMKMLNSAFQKNPKERFADAREMLDFFDK